MDGLSLSADGRTATKSSSPGLADGAYGPRLASGEHRYTLRVSCARRGAASVWIGFADAGGADANHDGTVDRAEFTAYGRAMVSVGAALARSGAGSADAVEGATIAVVVDLAARTFKWRVEDGGANRPPIEDDGGWVDGGTQLPAQVRLWVLLGGDVGDGHWIRPACPLLRWAPPPSAAANTGGGASLFGVPFSEVELLLARALRCDDVSLRHAFADEGFNISKYSALLNRLVADGLETRRVYRSAAELGAAVSATARAPGVSWCSAYGDAAELPEEYVVAAVDHGALPAAFLTLRKSQPPDMAGDAPPTAPNPRRPRRSRRRHSREPPPPKPRAGAPGPSAAPRRSAARRRQSRPRSRRSRRRRSGRRRSAVARPGAVAAAHAVGVAGAGSTPFSVTMGSVGATPAGGRLSPSRQPSCLRRSAKLARLAVARLRGRPAGG